MSVQAIQQTTDGELIQTYIYQRDLFTIYCKEYVNLGWFYSVEFELNNITWLLIDPDGYETHNACLAHGKQEWLKHCSKVNPL